MKLIPRKQLFVDRQVQAALLYRIAIYWCFSVVTVSLVALSLQAILYTGPAESFFDYFDFGTFFTQYGLIIVSSLVLVPIIMFDVLLTSNRFAGPLYRMRRSMRALADGNSVQPIKFREKDFLQDMAAEFNALADRVEQLQAELDEARRRSGRPVDFQPAGAADDEDR